jgi:tetratricopeptide (TPR) repeat protein
MRLALLSVILGCSALWPVAVSGEDPDVATARKARDRGDVPTLRKEIAEAQKRASERKSFEDYLRLALLYNWMCEAAESSNDRAMVKGAAEAGVAAAEEAVRLNPKSSDAHQLLADSLGLLIPNVFGGGMRYGRRSTELADRAIELDPKNPNAYVTRAISYLYSPEAFGGNKQKGFELLQKAVEADRLADTPHIWLAQFYLDAGKLDDAQREIDEARRLNPGRLFAQYVHDQVTAARKKLRRSSSPGDL